MANGFGRVSGLSTDHADDLTVAGWEMAFDADALDHGIGLGLGNPSATPGFVDLVHVGTVAAG